VLTIEIKREIPYRTVQWRTIGSTLHRHYNQACIEWHIAGRKCSEEYIVNGKMCREPTVGPARTGWRSNGQKYFEEYRVGNKLSRDLNLGPARINWSNSGQKHFAEYWIDGKKIYGRDYSC